MLDKKLIEQIINKLKIYIIYLKTSKKEFNIKISKTLQFIQILIQD